MTFIDSVAFWVMLMLIGTPFLSAVLGVVFGYWLSKKIFKNR